MNTDFGWMQRVADATGLSHWTVVVFTVIVAALLLDFLQRLLMRRLEKAAQGTPNIWDDSVTGAASGPLSLAIWVLALSVAVLWMPAVGEEDALVSPELVRTAREVGLLSALGWFLVSLVKRLEESLIEKGKRRSRQVDATTVQAMSRVLRIAVIVTVGLGVLDTMGFSISGLLAAGGIGGLAIGLAAKDMLANLFGGMTIYMDRPFGVGDWIRSPDRNIEGVVQDIGWRQTTIMRFDKRPLYVPNSVFSTIVVENPSRMTHRRINEVIGIRYEDIAVMAPIVDEVRDLLTQHEEIDESQTLMTHFDVFSDSSIDFFIYCFTHTVDWQHYHAVKQDVLLSIADIIERHGAEIAFPTTTVHVETTRQFAGIPDPDEVAPS